MNASYAYLGQLPKADLHVHLDGSLRFSTLIELAKAAKVVLPSYTEAGLRELVFKPTYASLTEYLTGFVYTNAVLLEPENIERVAYELAIDCAAENICLLEVRFAPQKHLSKDILSMHTPILAMHKGLSRAAQEINEAERVTSGAWPPFLFSITTCCMRSFSADREIYFSDLIKRNSLASYASLLQIAANELAEAAIFAREEGHLAIVGFDIAGKEKDGDVQIFEPAFSRIKRHSLHATVHAGEELGPENIYNAISILGAERIGHGLHLFDTSKIIDELVRLIHARNVAIEACPSSNFQTNPSLKGNLKNHVLPKLLDHKIPAVICTDNRLISHTNLTKEYTLVASGLELTPPQMQEFALAGFIHSFFPGSQTEKSAYIGKVETLVETIVQSSSRN